MLSVRHSLNLRAKVCGVRLLWNALNTDNFSFLLFNFSDFILILFCFVFDFLLDDEEARDIAVT